MKGYVVLENGDVFEGVLHNYEDAICGEIVFFNGTTGYDSVLTDPASKNKIIVFTNPLIGNCGINKMVEQYETVHATSFIASEVAEEGFHYESVMTLSQFSKKHVVPFMTNVDTRAIVKRIREHGEMRAFITTEPEHVQFSADDKQVIRPQREIESFGSGPNHIVIIDYGWKRSFAQALAHEGYKVTVVPYNITFDELTSIHPHTVIFSDGPGKPVLTEEEREVMKKIATTYPTFGVGLGHQLLAVAFGGAIDQLHYGHRSFSQPIIDVESNKVYMTAQNHRYIVDEKSLAGTGLKVKFSHIHDRSVEGLVHEHYSILTMQFHPLGSGPTDIKSYFLSMLQTFLSKGREKVYA